MEPGRREGEESRLSARLFFEGLDVWSKTTLGPIHTWPSSLQSYTKTLASFPYPAAIFWGDELLLLHNRAWAGAGGIDGQGRPLRSSLSATVWSSLHSSLNGGVPTQLASKDVLMSNQDDRVEYTVLVSPLFEHDKDNSSGVLLQLLPTLQTSIPQAIAYRSNQGHPDSSKQKIASMWTADSAENVPFYKRPSFRSFLHNFPSGLAIIDHEAKAVLVNQQFYELTSHRGDDKSFKSWPQSIDPGDHERVMDAYREALISQRDLRTEFRIQEEPHPWRLLLLTPLQDDNLQHFALREDGGFICNIVDITTEKNAELTERRSAREARERKDQQERFIDMISHEIRNPLSAVLHCAEDIDDAVRSRAKEDIRVTDILEAVETINLCIAHQKNIVDDVLSFSKLDASLLSLSPRTVQPRTQMATTLKMFQPELRKQGIDFEYRIDHSYVDCNIDWVIADLLRIGQVLINLVTNAIKFTAKSDGTEKIIVSCGASMERPASYPPNVVFFESEESAIRMDATTTSEWGNGEVLYLMVAVKDTGIGISNEGQKRLFERFRQAKPKTEEIYGGSGLGLNISRKLCHLHGGEIGVKSKEGKGSTFGFFFKIRRSKTPSDHGRLDKNVIREEQLRDYISVHGNTSADCADQTQMPQTLHERPVTRIKSTHQDIPSVDTTSGSISHESRRASETPKKAASQGASERASHSWENRPAGHPRISEVAAGMETTTGSDEDTTMGTSMASLPSERPHVLLVEDNQINQRILFRKLKAKGYNVTIANNGQEAVAAVRSAPRRLFGGNGSLDCILMDQEMPVMDGNAATKAVRALEENGDIESIPILGVTANVRDEQRKEMLSSGMSDVITKPYKIEDMLEKINNLIGNVGK